LIGQIQPGENVLVVDGPRCADSYTWWLVRSLEGLEGWTAEGDTEGYWLVDPISAWYQLPNPLTSQGVKTYDLRELKISANLALVNDITGNYNSLATPLPRQMILVTVILGQLPTLPIAFIMCQVRLATTSGYMI
jgi:hypothetical protein